MLQAYDTASGTTNLGAQRRWQSRLGGFWPILCRSNNEGEVLSTLQPILRFWHAEGSVFGARRPILRIWHTESKISRRPILRFWHAEGYVFGSV